jgi:hypothetical protein
MGGDEPERGPAHLVESRAPRSALVDVPRRRDGRRPGASGAHRRGFSVRRRCRGVNGFNPGAWARQHACLRGRQHARLRARLEDTATAANEPRRPRRRYQRRAWLRARRPRLHHHRRAGGVGHVCHRRRQRRPDRGHLPRCPAEGPRLPAKQARLQEDRLPRRQGNRRLEDERADRWSGPTPRRATRPPSSSSTVSCSTGVASGGSTSPGPCRRSHSASTIAARSWASISIATVRPTASCATGAARSPPSTRPGPR